MTKQIVNCETGEIIERPLNDEELAQQEIDEANFLAKKELADAELNEKTQSKLALLDRLGITEDEAKLLLS